MNFLHSTTIARITLGVSTLAVLGASGAWAIPQDAGQDQRVVELRTEFVFAPDDPAAPPTMKHGSESIMMRLDDGQLSVWVNGDEIDPTRLRDRDGRIEILDENGEVLRELELEARRGNLPFGWRFRFGEDDDVLMRGLDRSAEQPAVMIGVHVGAPGPALEHHLGLESRAATMITAVYKGLPADKAGLGEFDVVTEIDGVRPCPPEVFGRLLAESEPGETMRLAVISSGRPGHVDVQLDAYSAERLAGAEVIGQAPRRIMDVRGMLEPDVSALGFGNVDADIVMVAPFGRGLDNVFIDDEDRVFEVPGRPYGGGGDWDARMSQLDARIAELKALLQRALAPAE